MDWDGPIPCTTTGAIDVEGITEDHKARKLSALNALKSGSIPFVKYPSGNQPLNTRYNPDIWPMPFPTLLPFGVGEFQDERLNDRTAGTRMAQMKSQVQRYLQLYDKRFQTHPSFMFVMHNTLLRGESSYNSKVAVKRKFFPLIKNELSKVKADTIQELERKLKLNAFHRPESDAEKVAFDLLKHIQWVATHVQGSAPEFTQMREEIRSLSRVHGLPQLFVTINPADAHNPICKVLCGSEIDLDVPFVS